VSSPTRRRRILIFIKGLGLGGAERLIVESVPAWDRDTFEYEVAYVLPWKDQLVPELVGLQVRVHCLAARAPLLPRPLMALRHLLRMGSFDLVHAHLPTAGVAARLVSPVPVVYTEHSLASSHRWLTGLLNRITYPRNAAVTAVSEAVATSVARYRSPVEVVPNGVSCRVDPVEAEKARAELELDGRPLVVHVGNIRPQKGHRNLIEVAERLKRANHPALIVSIGGEKLAGDRTALEREVEERGLREHVRFLGRRSDARAFIAAADVVVNPSDDEGLPVALLEALALERPVVATAVGGVPAVIRSGETGILVEKGDSAGMAEGITTLLADPEQARRLGKAGRAMVEARYGIETMVRSFEHIYRRVLGGLSPHR
jgi:glycosyltransferase involved in cell wall biosynthesis